METATFLVSRAVGIGFLTALLITGVRVLRSPLEAPGAFRPLGGLAGIGVLFAFAVGGIPRLLDLAGVFLCPTGHEMLTRAYARYYCAGASGAFTVGEVSLFLVSWALFATVVGAYALALAPVRTLMQRARWREDAGPAVAAGLVLAVLITTVAAVPAVLLPVAKPVNLVINRNVVHPSRLMDTPLVSAAGDHAPDRFASLLEASSHINVRGRGNKTALITAVEHGKADNARLLLDRGADTSLKDDGGRTALDYLAMDAKGGTTAFKAIAARLRAAASRR